ncbi:uncharacterized protein LOC117188670 [Drosophila miranda]|uniref:uncharacterized protein LOC117188670 n=1 Tax=Drosophila miranda TaxID=7229 RepID=UPI00143F1A5F|nr:uncharacterized protein LOC117188670 [Drosophila miranda]
MIRSGLKSYRACRRRVGDALIARDYYGAIQMLIAIAYVLGITPFVVAHSAKGESGMRQSWYGFVNAISRWVLLAYCYTYINLHNESLIGYFMQNRISQFSTRLHNICGIWSAVFTFIMPLLLRRHLQRFIEDVMEVDRRLDRLRHPVNFNAVFGVATLVLALVALLDTIITVTCLVCLAQMEVRASWQLIFILVYELMAISMTIVMFSLIKRTVQRRLNYLHTKISKNGPPIL